MTNTNEVVEVQTGREYAITRVLDAPRAIVFQAWTDPERVARWWGPRGFTNPRCELDVRPGGAIRIDMRGPDGTVYPMTGSYEEIVAPERLVFTASALDERGKPLFKVLTAVTFDERGGATTLTLQAHVINATPEATAHLDGMDAGWTQSLERLGEYVAREAGSTADREIVTARVFDAPRGVVFKAWTDPQQIVRWWGPRGFTTTTYAMDVRPGGVWRFVMHGPDGRDYQNQITYLDVMSPERLVYRHGGDEDVEPVEFQMTVTFEDEGRRTRLTMRAVFDSAAERDRVIRTYGADEGGKQTLERLSEYLRESGRPNSPAANASDRPFTIARVVNAPRDLVFTVWTQRDHLMRWFGPKGCTIPACTLDLRPGGVFHYCMRFPDGAHHWGRWVFREIVPRERLVFVVSFSDEAGNVIRAPFNPDWSLETLSTITFARHAGKGGGTVVAVQWAPINATASERKAFADGHDSMRQGWTGTMDQLADYLATL